MPNEPGRTPGGPQQDPSGQIRIPGPPRVELSSDEEMRGRVVTSGAREQDQSIRDRKQLLFDDEEDLPGASGGGEGVLTQRRFRDYLQNTPASPLSNGTKLMLYFAAALVGLMLLAALLKGGR